MKVKTNELTGAALDWAVAKAEGHDMEFFQVVDAFMPSIDWELGGPIIEREKMRIAYNFDEHIWEAGWDCHVKGWGDTPLIASMRCYVASVMGEEVEVPDELA